MNGFACYARRARRAYRARYDCRACCARRPPRRLLVVHRACHTHHTPRYHHYAHHISDLSYLLSACISRRSRRRHRRRWRSDFPSGLSARRPSGALRHRHQQAFQLLWHHRRDRSFHPRRPRQLEARHSVHRRRRHRILDRCPDQPPHPGAGPRHDPTRCPARDRLHRPEPPHLPRQCRRSADGHSESVRDRHPRRAHHRLL